MGWGTVVILSAVVLFFLISTASYILLQSIQKTALVVVHPWNFGLNEAEWKRNLKKFQIVGLRRTAEEDQQMIADHREYYQLLERYISTHVYGHIILFEEQGRQEASLARIKGLLKDNYSLDLLSRILTKFFHHDLDVVLTVVGRATPAGETSWQEVIDRMYAKGIRRVEIVGSYLGIKDELMVCDPSTFGHFCVNEAFAMLDTSKKFADVDVLRPICYEREATAKNPAVYVIERTRACSWRKQKKKKKKK